LSNDYKNTDKELATQTKALINSFTERIDDDVNKTVNQGIVSLVIVFSIIFIVMVLMIPLMNWFFKKLFWYDSIIDSIPQPISVTDMNRKTTLVNKSVENLLGKSKANMVGIDCGQVWNAPICNTKDCGIECLKRGTPETIFNAGEFTFRVEASYLTDSSGHNIGHIEVVNDITQLMKKQNQETELVENIQGMSSSFILQTKGIVSDSQYIAQGSTEQAAAVQQLSSTINEIAGKTKENAEMAEKAAELSSAIKVKAEKGSHQMDELMASVKEITDASAKIEKVIKVIDDIAFQTNILALNAAVEAARAGAAGKGFAVVAEEVRNLASKSAEAAKNTGGLIENSVQKANHGMTIAVETASSLKEIVSGINQNAEIISRIAASSEEQESAISQIDTGVSQVASVIQENTSKAEASATASLEMSRQMDELESLLGNFTKKKN
jgi:methyl-accepting chemotaxis protein